VKIFAMLVALWGAVSLTAVRHWWTGRVGNHADEQLRLLLSGAVVPAPRQAPDDVAAGASRPAAVGLRRGAARSSR
jgi:hypothetical protein